MHVKIMKVNFKMISDKSHSSTVELRLHFIVIAKSDINNVATQKWHNTRTNTTTTWISTRQLLWTGRRSTTRGSSLRHGILSGTGTREMNTETFSTFTNKCDIESFARTANVHRNITRATVRHSRTHYVTVTSRWLFQNRGRHKILGRNVF